MSKDKINFETLQLDDPRIPEDCKQAFQDTLGPWPEPGEFCPDAAKWAMAWLLATQNGSVK